jgi:hypothetical protein
MTGPEIQALVYKAALEGYKKALSELQTISGTERMVERLENIAEHRADEVDWKTL